MGIAATPLRSKVSEMLNYNFEILRFHNPNWEDLKWDKENEENRINDNF